MIFKHKFLHDVIDLILISLSQNISNKKITMCVVLYSSNTFLFNIMLFISFDIKPLIIFCLQRQINIREYLFSILIVIFIHSAWINNVYVLGHFCFRFYYSGFGFEKSVSIVYGRIVLIFMSSKHTHTHVIRRGNGLLKWCDSWLLWQ